MDNLDNQILVIFGASGDLTARKLIPALYDLYKDGFLAKNFAILGVSRSNLSDTDFRNKVVFESEFLKEKYKNDHTDIINGFAERLFYQDLGDSYDSDFGNIAGRISQLNQEFKTDNNYIFYLSTPPNIYEVVAKNLAAKGLNDETNGWKRIVVEKPFGYSLETAKALNTGLQKYFNESQIYRIDHYLGKETVQNLLVTRFSNAIFEPLWNKNHIRHIEITNAESDGVGSRGGYYDKSGALRDMFQSHLMQIVSLVAMEPPINDNPEEIRNEKVKALKAIRIMDDPETLYHNTNKGQYLSAIIDGKKVKGYREEEGVATDSTTETYAAIKFFIDNERWQDVPFYVRTAKRMPTKVTEVVIHFKPSGHQLFKSENTPHDNNKLLIRIQPDEGILMKFGVKVPGQGFNVVQANMDFYYSSLENSEIIAAYERLLLDVMQGDATLYARADEVEAAWAFVDPILNYWKNDKSVVTHGYSAGVWGPKGANELIDGISMWRNPCENLADVPSYCVLEQMNMKLNVYENKTKVAEKFATCLKTMIANHKWKVHIALSGGSTPKILFDLISENYKNEIDWSKVCFYWGDERLVPPTDDESNYKMTVDHLLSNISIPEENIFRIKGENNHKEEVARYSKVLETELPIVDGTPQFDMVILGMGDDGHTASIFPYEINLWHSEENCVIATHPDSGQKRVSITGKIINNAKNVTFLVTGGGKSEKVREIINKEKTSNIYPATLVAPKSKDLVWFLDEDAASEIG